jgi:hypothetical protein
MAFTKTSTLVNNFQEFSIFEDAYLKVTSFSGSKETISFALGTFKEKDGILLQKQEYVFAIDLDGPNPIKQAYEYLKTLPEFADATDC